MYLDQVFLNGGDFSELGLIISKRAKIRGGDLKIWAVIKILLFSQLLNLWPRDKT